MGAICYNPTMMRNISGNPVFCALDTVDLAAAERLAGEVAGSVGGLKIGKEFFTAHGPQGVSQVVAGRLPLFLDLKFHDIPNTVAGGVRAAIGAVAPFMMTVHASGGRAMLQAAADAAATAAGETGTRKPLILGVTVLTSLDQDDLRDTGVVGTVADQVRRLADLAQANGLDGVICSPHEIKTLRADRGPAFKLVVPGIRPASAMGDDQKRVMTPADAVALGADYLVIGRPITAAGDPAAAARAIDAEIGRAA